MFRVFHSSTADGVWQQMADAFRGGEFETGRGSRAGMNSEILHAAVSISDPRQRWVHSRRPAINIAFALAEIIWIVQGRNDAAFLNFFNKGLPQFAGDGIVYHGAYGHRLRTVFGFDQLERAFLALKNNPTSRQIALQFWHPSLDFPDQSGQAAAPDIPCNVSSLLKVRDGRLEWLQIMRSNDVFRGFPYNVVQFTALQEILAGWLGLRLGEYHHISDSLHVYDETAENIRGSARVQETRNSDELAVSRDLSKASFDTLERLVERIIDPSSNEEDLVGNLSPALTGTFKDIALVLCAEACRRKKNNLSLVEKVISRCSSTVFCRLYDRWLERTARKTQRL